MSLILMLSAAHPPEDLRVVRKQGAALAAAGWRVRHLCPDPGRPVPPVLDGVEIATFRRRRGLLARLFGIPALAIRAARARPAAIQAHEPDSWAAALLAARACGARVVLDVHEHYPSRLDARLPRALRPLLRPLARRLLRAACRAAAARADALVLARDGLDEGFGGTAPRATIRNLALPVPVAPRIHAPGPVTLVHLGAITRARGALLLPEVLRLSGAHLSLVGRFTDGSEAAFLAEAARLGVAARIARHGWLPPEAALALAARADIGLVLFQPGEENHRLALPHKLFDCMLAGLPVIVPRVTAAAARLAEETGCGLVVDSADPRAVAAAVARLSDPALRAAMGAAGRAAAQGRFGWGAEAARLVAFHAELDASVARI